MGIQSLFFYSLSHIFSALGLKLALTYYRLFLSEHIFFVSLCFTFHSMRKFRKAS